MKTGSRFAKVAGAGIAFQAGSTAIDSATIMSALVFNLTGSSLLVGAVTAILRFGWLFPQLFVGFLAQARGSSMRYYVIGAFGRATCMALLALALFAGANWPPAHLAFVVMVLWTFYAFVSGIVAVPYNDIVATVIPSDLRSRLLAVRFFGGGVVALAVAALADRMVVSWPFPASYAAIVALGSLLMFISSTSFTTLNSQIPGDPPEYKTSFFNYLRDGLETFKTDHAFRAFVHAQWCGGFVLMAAPFYVVQASLSGFDLSRVAFLLAMQTAGALASNILWGWWGDILGKRSLLTGIAVLRIVPPAIVALLASWQFLNPPQTFLVFSGLFFFLGALANGLTIAVIGYLMEISPPDRRPAYSGYFNAITAPAYLLPLVAGLIASLTGLITVFIISAIAAASQAGILMRLNTRALSP